MRYYNRRVLICQELFSDRRFFFLFRLAVLFPSDGGFFRRAVLGRSVLRLAAAFPSGGFSSSGLLPVWRCFSRQTVSFPLERFWEDRFSVWRRLFRQAVFRQAVRFFPSGGAFPVRRWLFPSDGGFFRRAVLERSVLRLAVSFSAGRFISFEGFRFLPGFLFGSHKSFVSKLTLLFLWCIITNWRHVLC